MSVQAAQSIMVFGKEVIDLPNDLFIPSDALYVLLQHFEGPLDLLLYLIRKQNMDILDIPMARVTQQYLQYIAHMDGAQMDLAAEYLLMAAILLEIKSRLLLPQAPSEEAEEEDPRAELARRLLLYEQMKYAAECLDTRPQAGRDFLWAHLPQEITVAISPPQVSIADLQQAWLHILHRAKQFSRHQVAQETLSVRAQMSDILRRLQAANNSLYFFQLFDIQQGAALAVVTFIALLELVKESLIELNQEAAFSPIEITLNHQST